MARKIIWTNRSKKDRIAIFEYWFNRNKSKSYSHKLHILFQEAAKLISEHPHIGKPTSEKDVRIKIVGDYLMFYKISNDSIYILTIWDSRQNPDKLKL